MSYRLNQGVIRDAQGRVKFTKPSSTKKYEMYHIGVWLEADEESALERVECVEYELHESFSNRNRYSGNRRNNFSITFWSWGTFRISAKIQLAGDPPTVIEIYHDLDYDLPADDGTNYVAVPA